MSAGGGDLTPAHLWEGPCSEGAEQSVTGAAVFSCSKSEARHQVKLREVTSSAWTVLHVPFVLHVKIDKSQRELIVRLITVCTFRRDFAF